MSTTIAEGANPWTGKLATTTTTGTGAGLSNAAEAAAKSGRMTVGGFGDDVSQISGHSVGSAALPDEVVVTASRTSSNSLLPTLGRKLDFVFGKATGSLHNIERSTDMLRNLNRIGIYDNPAGRSLFRSHINQTFNNTNGIIQSNGRVLRESLLMGPRGGIKVTSIWDAKKLITIMLKGG